MGVVRREALGRRWVVSRLGQAVGLRQEGLEDGLDECKVQLERDVDEAELAILENPLANCLLRSRGEGG